MDKKNRYISATYQLYSVTDGNKELEEQTSPASPFQFITGFGIALDSLEQHLIGLDAGEAFDFTLQPGEAFGERQPEGIFKMEREAFIVDGKFDHEHIYPKAVITLVDAQQQYQMATVLSIEDDGVTLDTNHPYAGKVLNFTGKVIENREATEEEIQNLIKQLTGGCGCSGGCGGDCGNGCNGGCS